MPHDERRATRAEQRAMMLFGQIAAELNPESFSLEEIWDEFGRHTETIDDRPERSTRSEGEIGFWKVKPKGELDTLVRLGLIEPTGEKDTYRFTDQGIALAEHE